MNLINTVPRVDPKDLENMINTSMNVGEIDEFDSMKYSFFLLGSSDDSISFTGSQSTISSQ